MKPFRIDRLVLLGHFLALLLLTQPALATSVAGGPPLTGQVPVDATVENYAIITYDSCDFGVLTPLTQATCQSNMTIASNAAVDITFSASRLSNNSTSYVDSVYNITQNGSAPMTVNPDTGIVAQTSQAAFPISQTTQYTIDRTATHNGASTVSGQYFAEITTTIVPSGSSQNNQNGGGGGNTPGLLNSSIASYIPSPEPDLCGPASPGNAAIDPERTITALSSSNPPVEGRHPGYCPHFGYQTTGNPHSGTNIVEYFVGGVDFGTPKTLTKYVMKFPLNSATPSRQIRSFSIQGSDDQAAWTTLFTGEALDAENNPANSVQEYPLTGIGPYRYYRIWAHTNWGWDYFAYTNAYIFRWEWWGY